MVQDEPNYWTEGTYDDWLSEMAGGRLILERFANITDGSVIGRLILYSISLVGLYSIMSLVGLYTIKYYVIGRAYTLL